MAIEQRPGPPSRQPSLLLQTHKTRLSDASSKLIASNKPNNPTTMNSHPVERMGSRSPTDHVAGGRSSFSSVRETSTTAGLAQTFTQSHISSLADAGGVRRRDSGGSGRPRSPTDETAVIDDGSWFGGRDDDDVGEYIPPLTHPSSRLHAVWYPSVVGLRSWKQIQRGGRMASRSYDDLKAEFAGWESTQQGLLGPAEQVGAQAAQTTEDPTSALALAHIERLPTECLAAIIQLLVVEIPPNGISTRNKDLMALLLTSRTIYQSTLSILYHHVTIPHSRIFRKFHNTLAAYPTLGAKVRRLDFSHFNPSSLFETASERSRATNLTPDTLGRALDLMPFLREFLVQEHIDDELSPAILEKLFFGLPRLVALDFAGCSSALFKRSFSSLLSSPWPDELSIRRLSLHKCLTLTSDVLKTILPRLNHLTHLDVAATRITDTALMSIPRTARLSHLNLAKCKLLSASTVISFLGQHPAAKRLVFLSLGADAVNHQLLDVGDVTALLPVLPTTLRSLSIKGSLMDPSHVGLLAPLTQQLEELALGRRLPMPQFQRLLTQHDHAIRYLDLTDVSGQELSIDTIFGDRGSLLNAGRNPLEVIELAELAHKRLARSQNALGNTGWTIKEIGQRAWIVRLPKTANDGSVDTTDGHRTWKMGAESWGMRKVPVAHAEVGGMYGSFMFGRKL